MKPSAAAGGRHRGTTGHGRHGSPHRLGEPDPWALSVHEWPRI